MTEKTGGRFERTASGGHHRLQPAWGAAEDSPETDGDGRGGGAAIEVGVREFSERWLPSRGWRRVLLGARPGAREPDFLVRRGYDVTPLAAALARTVEARGGGGRWRADATCPASSSLRSAFDAALVLVPVPGADEREGARIASRSLRPGGLLLVARSAGRPLGRLALARLGLVRLSAPPVGMAAYRRWAP